MDPSGDPGRDDLRGRLRELVGADLFSAAGPAHIGPGAVALVVLSGLVLMTASLLRQTGISALDTIWAEDGAIFLAHALQASPLDSFGTAYAGYLHAIPRTVSEIVTLLPLAWAATALALAGAALSAGAAIVVYIASAGHLRSPMLRALLAALVVLQPLAAVESLNSVALAQWPLTYAAFWVALWRPARLSATLFAGGLLLLTILSAPLAVLLAPVLLVRVLVVGGWRDRLPAALFALGLALQAWVVFTQPGIAPPPSVSAADLAATYGILVTTPAAFGVELATALRAYAGGAVAVAAVAAWVGVTAFALRPGGAHRLTALLAAGMSVTALVVTIYARSGTAAVIGAFEQGLRPNQTRFALVPVLLLTTVLALALDRQRVPLQVAVIAFVALVAGMDFFVTNDRTTGPSWSAEVVDGVLACRAGADAVDLQTSPGLPVWRVEARCSDLPP